jgi:hypothetical protein
VLNDFVIGIRPKTALASRLPEIVTEKCPLVKMFHIALPTPEYEIETLKERLSVELGGIEPTDMLPVATVEPFITTLYVRVNGGELLPDGLLNDIVTGKLVLVRLTLGAPMLDTLGLI